jgi:hypothetical protein
MACFFRFYNFLTLCRTSCWSELEHLEGTKLTREIKLLHCHFIHHKSHTSSPGFETERKEPAPDDDEDYHDDDDDDDDNDDDANDDDDDDANDDDDDDDDYDDDDDDDDDNDDDDNNNNNNTTRFVPCSAPTLCFDRSVRIGTGNTLHASHIL